VAAEGLRRLLTARPVRPVVLGVLVALVAVLLGSVLLGPGSGAPLPPGGGIARLRAEILPPVAQPGARPASADRATTVVQVESEARWAGEQVTLQRRNLGTWFDLVTAPLGRSGKVAIPAPAPDGDRNTLLRVVATDRRSVRSARLSYDDWQLAFDDEFTGEALDPAKWGYRQLGVLNPDSDRSRSESSADAVAVKDGTLRLTAKKNPAVPGQFLNGHISTESTYSFTYGLAAARIKFHKPRGMHGSFWLQSPIFGAVPGDAKLSGAEIDTVEYFGSTYPDGGLGSFAYHLGKDGRSVKVGGLQTQASANLPPDDAWWKRFHVFSVEWNSDSYVFRIDGRETFAVSQHISGVPEFLVLSLLSSDWELKDLARSALPATMKVDWVRVWQPTPR
jgi:beta-glucanase (GH16 family)